MKCFHGTSLKNALSIIAGNDEKQCGVWGVSDCDGAFYFYPADKIAENDLGADLTEDADYVYEYCVTKAKWHGQAALCHAEITENTFVVLEMEIPEILMSDDYSCDNMADVASFILLDRVKEITFEKIHVGKLSVYQRPAVLAQIIDNPHFTDCAIDSDLVTMAQMFNESGAFFELDEIETTEFSFQEFKNEFM